MAKLWLIFCSYTVIVATIVAMNLPTPSNLETISLDMINNTTMTPNEAIDVDGRKKSPRTQETTPVDPSLLHETIPLSPVSAYNEHHPFFSEFVSGDGCQCTIIYDPVCGSNNVSYYNVCLLHCINSKDSTIHATHSGNCIRW